MHFIANKPLVFNADKYEEWMSCRRISQGNTSAIITAIIKENQIHFKIDNADFLNMSKEATFGLASESSDLGGRIQYIKSCNLVNLVDPIICHIFYEGKRLSCIRFAMTSPDRIIEFYGKLSSIDGTVWPVFSMGRPRFKSIFSEEISDLYRLLLKGNTVNLTIMDHQFAVVAFCLKKYCALRAMADDPDGGMKERVFTDASSIVSQFYPHFADEAIDDARNWFFQIADMESNASESFIDYYYGQLSNGEDINYPRLFHAFQLH